MMSFGDAVHYLKFGGPERKVARTGWNGKGMWLALQRPDEHSKMGLPYLYMSTVDGKLVPWLASQTDILSDDWEIVVDETKAPTKHEQAIRLCELAAEQPPFAPFSGPCSVVGVDVHDFNGPAELARQALWSFGKDGRSAKERWLSAAGLLRTGWTPGRDYSLDYLED